jgi:hypothetical protein
MFKYQGDRIVNVRGQFVGVQNKENIVVMKMITDNWSRWNIRYVKDEQNYQVGEYHPGYGFYCGRQFYIQSKRDGRYLEHINNSAVVTKTPNGREEQKWSFNCVAEAIQGRSSYVLEL